MSETGTIEYCIKYAMRHGCMITSAAADELAQLCNDAKWREDYHERLQNLRVMMDCSIVELPERIAQLRADMARAAYEQRMTDARIVCDSFLNLMQYNPRMANVLVTVFHDIAGEDAERKT